MAQLMMVNPRKRRKTRRKAKRNPVARRTRRASVRRSPARRVRRYKRNPSARGITAQLAPAATNAAGALALDIIWGFLPVPDTVKVGPFRHIAKGAGAIALGMVARNVVASSTAKALSQGALTVVMHGALREFAQQMMPNVPLGYYSAGMPVSEYTGYDAMNGLDAYVTGGSTMSPYLSRDTLTKPFEGPSAADVASAAATDCLEKETMNGYYNY